MAMWVQKLFQERKHPFIVTVSFLILCVILLICTSQSPFYFFSFANLPSRSKISSSSPPPPATSISSSLSPPPPPPLPTDEQNKPLQDQMPSTDNADNRKSDSSNSEASISDSEQKSAPDQVASGGDNRQIKI